MKLHPAYEMAMKDKLTAAYVRSFYKLATNKNFDKASERIKDDWTNRALDCLNHTLFRDLHNPGDSVSFIVDGDFSVNATMFMQNSIKLG